MQPVWIDAVLSIAIGVGLAAAAGLRIFVPLIVLGTAARFGWVPLASGFEWLASDVGLGMLGVATVLEVAAYYIPWLDNLLDVAAGPLATIAGVVIAAAVMTDLPPAVRWSAAIIAGGGTAAAVQTLTSVARLKSTAMTGGFANPFLATLELLGSFAISIVAIVVPLLVIAVIAIGLLLLRRVRRAGSGASAPVT
jgi:hypothetical protein